MGKALEWICMACLAADFVVQHQRWATGAEEAPAEARKGYEGVCGQHQSCHCPAAFSSQIGIHFFDSTEKDNSLDLRVPWAGQVYRLLPEIILCPSECRSHCDGRKRYWCWATAL